ncbi:MAG: RNA polymerase factor sigma-54 [Phycisphaeraceae bacterium]|nr:RNA polymerase factor sigma-54 [Phycisphaeraceae bacterium]
MRFDTSQHMRMSQQMKLAPRMIQSMEILQMPLLQLEERIEQELEANPTLEAVEPGAEIVEGADAPADGPNEADLDAIENERPLELGDSAGNEDFERLDSFGEANPELWQDEAPPALTPSDRREDFLPQHASARLDGERDAKSDAMANTAARAASMTEQLVEQWRMSEVDESLRDLGEAIIGFIEDDGYLRTPLESVVDKTPSLASRDAEAGGPPTPEQMERALTAVQLLLEPAGIGARDVRECLLLQVDAMVEQSPTRAAEWAVVRRLIADHLDDLAQNRLPKISEKTGLSIDEVKRAVERMGVLSLAPGRRLAPESPSLLIPDAIVEYDEEQDRYIAYLNETRLPALRINQEYAKLAKEREAPKETKEFLRKNLSNASWLIDAVEQRKRTLLRVISVVVDAQRDYFDFGPQSLRPLPMTQVAEQLGVHVATVSRAVAEKHLMTPRGVVPLRGFFTGGTQTESGEEVSWDAVKAALKEVIDAEDKKSPLSDEALAEEVKKRGIEIARRTVAKYRDQLGIPSARLRKVF